MEWWPSPICGKVHCFGHGTKGNSKTLIQKHMGTKLPQVIELTSADTLWMSFTKKWFCGKPSNVSTKQNQWKLIFLNIEPKTPCVSPREPKKPSYHPMIFFGFQPSFKGCRCQLTGLNSHHADWGQDLGHDITRWALSHPTKYW